MWMLLQVFAQKRDHQKLGISVNFIGYITDQTQTGCKWTASQNKIKTAKYGKVKSVLIEWSSKNGFFAY